MFSYIGPEIMQVSDLEPAPESSQILVEHWPISNWFQRHFDVSVDPQAICTCFVCFHGCFAGKNILKLKLQV